ncbi:MEIOTIC F-BOX protein MOF-like [Triticum aestivum]|uniref:MEIOTIC F-BOX protein MOF-like n=1 Tax=Triticum aestivum TaxID=4565 RepID=UPI001D0080BA|nr:MEIOTIC F-BOX protein MOF-like [Triticum aestivum]
MAKRKRSDDVDRLSELPECLLQDIMSRLKARQLVQTCALSSTWRRLWLTAPCLDIDAGDEDDDEEEDEELDKFDDFVDSLLLRRGACASPLGTLRLSLPSSWPIWMRLLHDRSYCRSHTRWIRRGLRCSPATLDVSGIKLPPLASGPGTHRLNKLRLHNVCLHKDFEKHLSAGLPVLQDLEIRGTEMSKISRIASETLKNLIVDNSPTPNEGTRLHFLVDAPRLASLHLVVQFRRLGVFAVTVCEAASPVEASIHFLDKPKVRQVHGSCYYHQDDKDLLIALCKLLRSLSNVSHLELSGFGDMAVAEQHIPDLPSPGTRFPAGFYRTTVRTSDDDLLPRPMLQAILDEKQNKLPQLANLKTLVLDKCEIGDNIQTLWSFLHNTPTLGKLTLNNCGCQEFQYGAAASNIFKMGCTISSLKLVEIKHNARDDHEVQYTAQMEKILSMEN